MPAFGWLSLKPIHQADPFSAPFQPGGTSDIVAASPRIVSDSLGKKVIVDNRGGARGPSVTKWRELTARGYTLLLGSRGLVRTVPVQALSFDTMNDFARYSARDGGACS